MMPETTQPEITVQQITRDTTEQKHPWNEEN